MGAAAQNISRAKAAAQSIAGVLQSSAVFELFLFGPRATGRHEPADTWNFIVDFSRPVNAVEFFSFHDALQAALPPGSKVYLTSPQYDRESFLAYATKTAVKIYPAA